MSTPHDPTRVLLRGLRTEAWASYLDISRSLHISVEEVRQRISTLISDGTLTAEQFDRSLSNAARQQGWIP